MQPPTNLKILQPHGLRNKLELKPKEMKYIRANIVKVGEPYGFGEMSFMM